MQTLLAAPRAETASPFGAEVQSDGSVDFRLYAPAASSIRIALEDGGELLPMDDSGGGWYELHTERAQTGSLYRFVLPDGLRVPDPASRFQPQDVHGPSEVVAPGSYVWQDGDWKGRPWAETVLYELHIGTFTSEGTFRAAMEKLDHLAALGVTAIEIMPIADFPGKRNWGYDGALLYAPDSTYGRPDDLRALVDAAHARGISVLLDVVYNHFGPDGNYIQQYYPELLTARHKTSWGDALNFDSDNSDQTREFIIHNALYWIQEFHLDGLRFDAVHAIIDEGKRHILDEMAERLRAAVQDKPLHLILENEKNEAHRLERDDHGEPEHYTAQWNDDMHHVLHVAGTHEDEGYYKDYEGDFNKLGRALSEGFAFQGELSTCTGKQRGEPCRHLPPSAFVAFIQNHDQIGNRAFGERINAIASPEAVRALAAVYLLLPQIPMLFMGEEWAATQPFPYFCDFAGELGEKIREGRRKEFAAFPEFKDPEQLKRIPDPQAEETFQSAKLDWNQLHESTHAESLDWHKRILSVRREAIVPMVQRLGGDASGFRVVGPGAASIYWKDEYGNVLTLIVNLANEPRGKCPSSGGRILWQEGEQVGDACGPWFVRWSLQEKW